jgi:hypothetical protein
LFPPFSFRAFPCGIKKTAAGLAAVQHMPGNSLMLLFPPIPSDLTHKGKAPKGEKEIVGMISAHKCRPEKLLGLR